MLEKTVEAYLVERVRALGGTAYKFTSPARASVPDRIVILPPGRIYFVELKRPGGKLTRGQEREHEHLRRLGADVRMLDSIGAINAFLNEVQAAAADGAATDEAAAAFDAALKAVKAAVDPAHTDYAIIWGHGVAFGQRAAVSPATATFETVTMPHKWDETGERCVRCGDKDWMDTTCTTMKMQAPARADERTAFVEKLRELGADISPLGPRDKRLCITSNIMVDDVLAAARASQAAAPADAREPDAYILPYDLEVLKTYSAQCQVTLYREPRKTRVPLYAGCAPADAGEAVAEVVIGWSASDPKRVKMLRDVPLGAKLYTEPVVGAMPHDVRKRVMMHLEDISGLAADVAGITKRDAQTILNVARTAHAMLAQGAQGGKGGEA
ncbi:VRR-NUC domain-containing protein [Burkholderia gladioli]|uniref:VRR-NUC domain-containing protein n=1 Tax=Burkholderia gladioli TaxID=28095 RepID=UPI0019D24276|nr:VRR-NUC domain-containing protein [Burkholderia gladioli]